MLLDSELKRVDKKLKVDSGNENQDDISSSLPALLLKHASQNGDRIAAYFSSGTSLTYASLDLRSNQLANKLIQLGVVKGQLIGLCMKRSEHMLTGLLAILKVGAAYVPMDPAYPAERLSYMAETAGIALLLMTSEVTDDIDFFNGKKYCLDTQSNETALMPSTFTSLATADDLAYVIFTSGSTGKPKGVQIQHGAVCKFLLSMAKQPGFTANDRMLALTTLSFDIAVLELYLPLLCGGTVVVASQEESVDGVLLAKLIAQYDINVVQATPSAWRNLLAGGFKGGQNFKALCGGEAFPADLAIKLTDCCGEVWNMYGPTETTVWSSCYRLPKEGGPILIGKPIAATTFWVLDKNTQLVPVGEEGELYIGGAGLAKGYLNRSDLTAERFIESPLTDGLLYRTGDLVKENPAGDFTYYCRLDEQVKIRGFRIELGEIESVLMAHPLISQAVVVVKEISTMDQRLVAYLLFETGQLVSNQEVRKYLRVFLPEYMIPQLLVEIEDLPLTPNGKVDRKRLPDPIDDISNADQFYAPETQTQKNIAAIWSKQLGVKEISLSDHFYDIGGHSLLATLVIHEVESHFNISISAADMFSCSLEQLANRVDKKIVLLKNRKQNKNKSPAKWMQKIKKSLLGDRV